MFVLLLLLLWGVPEASAGDVGAHAEAIRLSQELRSLARRDHWAGVEHAYLLAVATGQPLPWEDHFTAANAALALGDVATARERLLAAKGDRDEREVIEGLWRIDTHFAPVDLRVDPGAELKVEEMPFDPQQARAVEHAQEELRESGTFSGMLPFGEYEVQGVRFFVTAGVGQEPVQVAVRSEPVRRQRRR